MVSVMSATLREKIFFRAIIFFNLSKNFRDLIKNPKKKILGTTMGTTRMLKIFSGHKILRG